MFLLHFSRKNVNINTEVKKMSFLFSKSSDALKFAEETQTYSVFYEETAKCDSNLSLHNCCEAVLCLTGDCTCLSGTKTYAVKGGDMFIFNQFEPHILSSKSSTSFARFGAFFHPDYIKMRSTPKSDLLTCFFSDKSNKITLNDAEIAKLENLFIVFRKDMGFGDDIAKNSAIDYFLILVNKYFDAFFMPCDKANDISRILEFINSHLSEDLSLDIISKNFDASVNHICMLFRNELGTTASKYISAMRISQAKKCLINGKSVSETAQMCGFPDYANFIRVFKKITGLPPGKFARL